MSSKFDPRRLCLVSLFALMCLALPGCGEPERARNLSRRTVEIGDIPEPVVAAAKKQLPDVEFADAWQNMDRDGKLHSYEIRGKNRNGKTREARVSPEGVVLETE